MKALKKLFLYKNWEELGNAWHSERYSVNDIEYTRTDAFIEKACEWLELNLSDRPKEDIKFWLEDFRQYMKGE